MSGRDGHLGELAAALADGALDGGTRDRALAHVAGCLACRSAVDDQRRAKDELLRLVAPEPPADLADRLRAIAVSGSIDSIGSSGSIGSSVPSAGSGGSAWVHVVAAAGNRSARLRRLTVESTRRPGGGSRPPGLSPRSAGVSPGSARPRNGSRRTRRMAGGITALALGLAVVVTLGPGRHQAPAVSPPVGQFTLEHAQTTGGFPGADPGAGAVMTVSVNR